MKWLIILCTLGISLVGVSSAQSADITLEIVIPDAWVETATDAVDSIWPGRVEAGKTKKQWAEYHIRQWLKEIIVQYKNRKDQETILDAGGYDPIEPDDIPLE
jgi:hypothetical protein